MRKKDLILLIIGILSAYSGYTQEFEHLEFNAHPKLIGEGVINTEDNEYRPAFSPDNTLMLFCKSFSNYARTTIVVSKWINQEWTQPEVAPFSGIFNDNDPYFDPNGKFVVFTSERPVEGSEEKKTRFWKVSYFGDNKWGEPELLQGVFNKMDKIYYPCLSANQNLYFFAANPNNEKDTDIYVSRFSDNYSKAELLTINSDSTVDYDPVIASDESFIIFGSINRPGYGGVDAYVSYNNGKNWTQPVNLGPAINDDENLFGFSLSPDNNTLYFTSRSMRRLPERSAKINYSQLLAELRGLFNGNGNIYELDISSIKEQKKSLKK